MLSIFAVQLQHLKRNPSSFLAMIGMTILFTLALGATNQGKTAVWTYYDANMSKTEAMEWVELLNRSETYEFRLSEEEKAVRRVREGNAQFALKLLPDDFRIVASVNHANAESLDYYIRTVYRQELMIRKAVEAAGPGVRGKVEQRLESPVLTVSSKSQDTEQTFRYDPKIQSLFGFTLFFAIFTITFSVNRLLEERRKGIWDRVILSPVSKTSMYAGHLLYCFAIGYLQILIVFLLFRYGFAFPIGSFPTLLLLAGVYIFAVVALGLLLAGLVRTSQQMAVLIPVVAVSSAMIGGAYWPLEIVTNPVLLALSKAVPVTYGMEAMKGVAYYGHSWAELLRPVSFLLLYGVVCMGIGINLIERRSK